MKRRSFTITVLIVWLGLTLPSLLSAAVRSDAPALAVEALQEGISLSGQWRFQPGDNLDWASAKYNDLHWSTMSTTRRWLGDGYPETGQMAWYRLTLQFDRKKPGADATLSQLGVRIPKVLSAYEMYAGGYLLGGVGKLPPLSEVNYDRQRVLAIPKEAVDENGRLVLALRVWGGSELAVSRFGGGIADGEFLLGRYSVLLVRGVLAEMPRLLIATLFAGFGLYHIYLYRRNRQLEALLWFGVLAMDIALYTFMQSPWKYVLDFSFVSFEKVKFVATYLLPALVIQAFWSVMGVSINVWLRMYQAIFVATAAAALILPGLTVLYHTLKYFHLISLPLVVLAPALTVQRALRGHAEARTLAIGALIFAGTCLNDVMIDFARLDANRLLPYGFVAVFLSMAVSLANRFTTMFNRLEVEVAERTADLQEINERLYRAARQDPLTGVLNRRGFVLETESEIQRVYRSGREFSLVLGDIDNFKALNDNYGHACGDEVLRNVALILRQRVRDIDKVARWGGEEFILLLPETNADGAATLAEKLRKKVADSVFEFNGQRIQLTMTFGLASHVKGESLDDCMARADRALYSGKQRGRNRVTVGNYSGLKLVN